MSSPLLRAGALVTTIVDCVLTITCSVLLLVHTLRERGRASESNCTLSKGETNQFVIPLVLYTFQIGIALVAPLGIICFTGNANRPRPFRLNSSQRLNHIFKINFIITIPSSMLAVFFVSSDFFMWNILKGADGPSEGGKGKPICEERTVPGYIFVVSVIHFLIKLVVIGVVVKFLMQVNEEERRAIARPGGGIGMPLPWMQPAPLGVGSVTPNDVNEYNPSAYPHPQ